MELYELGQFSDRIEQIESFLIRVAAAEEYLLSYGLRHAQRLEGYEDAIVGMRAFQEDFASFRRYMARLDRELSQQVNYLDSDAKLPEQMSLLQLNLQMHALKKPQPAATALAQVALVIPYLSQIFQRKPLFKSEDVSLQKVIVNLGRLRGLVKIARESLSWHEYADDEVLKPSNISSDRVIAFIETAEIQISELLSIPPQQRERILGYLQEAKREAASNRPSWSKIVGALVIVAAITSGLADAPAASRTLQDVIEYILGNGVDKPLQRFLPPPPEQQAIPHGDVQVA
ncbi:MAG TPA: hypothetical protein DDW98_12655 [Gammaproteobacteria bacterium]|nr:hypothetical protein [Gammaproteobacteria bacterium]